jgi:Phytanoyl-CoA dioxygenase (PhyH)
MLKKKLAQGLKLLTDKRYMQFYSQRRIRNIPSRERMADRLAARLPSYKVDGETSGAASTLKDRGYLFLDDLISTDQLHAMRAFFSNNVCADPYRSHLGQFIAPGAAPPETHVAFFTNETIIRAPHALEIANNPKVLSIVSGFLGAKPTISYMTAWWSMPHQDGKAEEAELFHRDVDDIRFVKLFCYLTDVDDVSGPHMFVPGSQNINKLTEIRRYEDGEIMGAFGADSLSKFTGEAGTAFLENTFGFHRGVPPSHKPRLLFQVLYTLRNSIYGPSKPVAQMGAGGIPNGLDPFINRVYLSAP